MSSSHIRALPFLVLYIKDDFTFWLDFTPTWIVMWVFRRLLLSAPLLPPPIVVTSFDFFQFPWLFSAPGSLVSCLWSPYTCLVPYFLGFLLPVSLPFLLILASVVLVADRLWRAWPCLSVLWLPGQLHTSLFVFMLSKSKGSWVCIQWAPSSIRNRFNKVALMIVCKQRSNNPLTLFNKNIHEVPLIPWGWTCEQDRIKTVTLGLKFISQTNSKIT